MNQDQIKGRLDQAKGKVKEETGDLIGNKGLENKGRAEKVGGKARAEVGHAKDKVKDAVGRR